MMTFEMLSEMDLVELMGAVVEDIAEWLLGQGFEFAYDDEGDLIACDDAGQEAAFLFAADGSFYDWYLF